jgi:hydrogenase nickel insertion protein HypA
MHEYSLVRALLQRVETEARSRAATAVRRIAVRIGPLAGISRDQLTAAYQLCRPGTLCAAADLVVTGDEPNRRCDACGATVADGHVLNCPACGSPAGLANSNALTLEHIEFEVL